MIFENESGKITDIICLSYDAVRKGVGNILSEARRKANKKWDENNVKRIGVVLRNDIHEAFMKYCKDNNKTISGAVNELIKNELHDKGYL